VGWEGSTRLIVTESEDSQVELSRLNSKSAFGVILLAFLLASTILANSHFLSSEAYAPQKGDYFKYSETTTVNNGQGVYTGYNDQTLTSGVEQMNAVSGSNVSASYNYSYQYSNDQGSSTSGSSSGNFTWSSNSYTYLNGSDQPSGFGGIPYSKPLYVWFAINTSLSVGSKFFILNTPFAVVSKNYSFQLPSRNYTYVQTIEAEGSGQYQRNDSYGVFTASYTWYEYFDPKSGYIVGYNYVEQDNGRYQGQAGSFTYTDDLYVTSTSYNLAAASPPPNNNTSNSASVTISPPPNNTGLFGLGPYLRYLIAAFVISLLIIVIGVYAATHSRRRKNKGGLPEHPYPPYTPPPSPPPSSSSPPWESKINLGSQPPEQVVIRDVAKVNCKYCGTLIPSTADHCPYCGAPRQ
jgi:hypothetical protein